MLKSSNAWQGAIPSPCKVLIRSYPPTLPTRQMNKGVVPGGVMPVRQGKGGKLTGVKYNTVY